MKLTSRDKYIIVVMIVIVFAYLIYTYVITPLNDELEDVRFEYEDIKTQVRDLDMLESELEIRKVEKLKLESELDDLKSNRDFDDVNYQPLISYLGMKADEYDIEIVSFTKLDRTPRGMYSEIPYDLKIYGEYADIIRFINSIYELNKYFFITDIELIQKDLLPLELVFESGNEVVMPFDWAEKFIDKINKGIPLEEIKKEYLETEREYVIDKIKEKVELSFKFYFINLSW